MHSPDEEYEQKEAFLHQVLQKQNPGVVEVLFQDEFTYYADAEVGSDFALLKEQPLAQLPWKGSDQRICGALNAWDGAVTVKINRKIGVKEFIQFLEQLTQRYPDAQKIYLVVDNCPMHFHPNVLAALVEQEHTFKYHLPPSWKKVQPKAQYRQMNINIQMVPLPTYASWLNPIEKLWKLLKKELLQLHPYANHFKELENEIALWLQQFQRGSPRLLRYCGLKKIDGIFADDFRAVDPLFFN